MCIDNISLLVLNNSMKIKQFIIPILLILILVIFNRVFLNTFNRANMYFSGQRIYNDEYMHPQKFFDKTWRVIAKDYYEPTLNHQDWIKWKNRYQEKKSMMEK